MANGEGMQGLGGFGAAVQGGFGSVNSEEPKGFGAFGQASEVTGFSGFQGASFGGFGALSQVDDDDDVQQVDMKEGIPPKNVKYFEGVTKLNKTETKNEWVAFGGDKAAVFEPDGSAYITSITERESKKSGVYVKFTQKLSRDPEGYGVITWRVELGAVVRRRPARNPFDESWAPHILDKIRDVVVDGVTVSAASKALAEELGASHSTIRANLWVADKWARGEFTTFTPHRTMIRPIYELLCELGRKAEVLDSFRAYCKETTYPSERIVEIVKEN